MTVLARDLTLRAPCGCEMRRAGSVNPSDGSIQGETTLLPCALHGAAPDLLRCLKEAVAAWELHDLDESDDSEAGEAIAEWKAAIAAAEPPAPEPIDGPVHEPSPERTP